MRAGVAGAAATVAVLGLVAGPGRAPATGGRLIVVEAPGPEVPAEGAAVKTRRPAVRLELGALVQVLAGGEPTGASGFRLRRTRLVADGQLERALRLQLHVEVEVNPKSELVDAPLADGWLGFDAAARGLVNLGRLRVGQQRIPFGGDLELGAEQLVLVERALPSRCLGPGAQERDVAVVGPVAGVTRVEVGEATGRDIGVRWDLAVPFAGLRLEAAAGLFAGSGPNRVSSAAPLYAARVALARGELGGRARVHFLVGASWAYAGARHVRDRCAFPFVAAATRADVHRVGGDARLRWRWLTVGAEAIGVLAATLAGGSFRAWSVAGLAAAEPLPEFLEVAVRAEHYDDDRGERFTALTAGAALKYFGERFRLQYNYTRRLPHDGAPASDGHLVAFLMAL